MGFFKNNYKTIIVIGVSIVLQVGFVTAMFSDSHKQKKEIDSTLVKNLDNFFDGNDEVDIIDESKINTVNNLDVNRNNNEVDRLEVQVGYEHVDNQKLTQKSKVKDIKQEKTKTKETNQSVKKSPVTKNSANKVSNSKTDKTNKANKEETNNYDKTNHTEDVKKIIIGKWKSVNDSNGRHDDMYFEFFEDGSFQNYDETQKMISNGTYSFSSPNRIKLNRRDITIVDDTKEENKTFISDITFKDDSSFTVADTNNFHFTNYIKVK